MSNPIQIEQHDAQLNGVKLHYVACGDGPLVVLLHGFPDFHGGWKHQIPALCEAGFRVIAPDLRGYNLSSKPQRLCEYSISRLSDDVKALIHHEGAQKAAVVGHDWGGAIAWHLAMFHPRCVSKLVALNAPHPVAFARELKNPKQWLKSWYILFFQLRYWPEIAIRWRDFYFLRRVFRNDPTRRDAFSDEDIEDAINALKQRGALTSALNYYRALRCPLPEKQRKMKRIKVPTLLLWGERDSYLGVGMSHDLEAWIPRIEVQRFADASHWLQRDEPQRVNEAIIRFLRSS